MVIVKPNLPFNDKNRISFEAQTTLLVFLLALFIRLLFLFATPDASAPFSPYYKGDTPVWLDYANAILSSSQFNLGLPMRPPGVAYLMALIWDGQPNSYLTLKLVWLVMGAATVSIFYLAILQSFGFRCAVIASIFMAASTALIIASTSPNNETPYLILIALCFLLWKPLVGQPALKYLVAWSFINALACLIRVEHVLFFAMSSICLYWTWAHVANAKMGWRRSLQNSILIWILFGLVLLPWQLHIWSQISHFNNQPLQLDKQTEQAYQQLERGLAVMDWTEESMQARESLPAFARRGMSNFVGTTVAVRGRMTVTGDDFDIIENAFGYQPQPINPFPLVSIYGGLNFYLANNPTARGGFSLGPLENPPPLLGGRNRYPAFLIDGLPPKDLTFTYPPHLKIINHGYALGWQWVREHPTAMLSLAATKLGLFWSGTTMGLTGYNFPLGLSGTRGVVDMVVPDHGPVVTFWRIAGLCILLGGLWAARQHTAIVPWLFLLVTKLTTTVMFYGYAREGLVVIPVFALLMALLINRVLLANRHPETLPHPEEKRRWFYGALILTLALISVEGIRWSSEPLLRLDGIAVGAQEPFPVKDYQQHRLTVGK